MSPYTRIMPPALRPAPRAKATYPRDPDLMAHASSSLPIRQSIGPYPRPSVRTTATSTCRKPLRDVRRVTAERTSRHAARITIFNDFAHL